MNYFVTAIDTDSGKTIVSAILCEALKADYWKPVQAGFPRDSESVKSLVSNTETVIHPEKYQLSMPASPHAAASADGIEIDLHKITLPSTSRQLIIEGAGGCLVPLNTNDFVIDIITRLKAMVILVSDLYLGSINHTLLTAEALKARNIPVKGIIFNGSSNPQSESIILHHTGFSKLLHIGKHERIDRKLITAYAENLKKVWNE